MIIKIKHTFFTLYSVYSFAHSTQKNIRNFQWFHILLGCETTERILPLSITFSARKSSSHCIIVLRSNCFRLQSMCLSARTLQCEPYLQTKRSRVVNSSPGLCDHHHEDAELHFSIINENIPTVCRWLGLTLDDTKNNPVYTFSAHFLCGGGIPLYFMPEIKILKYYFILLNLFIYDVSEHNKPW